MVALEEPSKTSYGSRRHWWVEASHLSNVISFAHLVYTPVMTSYRLVMICFWLADDENTLAKAIIFKMIKIIPLFSHQKHIHTWTWWPPDLSRSLQNDHYVRQCQPQKYISSIVCSEKMKIFHEQAHLQTTISKHQGTAATVVQRRSKL